MKKLMAVVVAFVLLSATVAGMLAQDASTPAATVGVLAQGLSTPVATPTVAGEPVPYIDESGNPIAEFTVTSVIRNWDENPEYYAPQPGNEFVRVTIAATSMVSRGSVTLDPYSFILQDIDGFVSQGNVVPTAEEDASGTFDYSGLVDLPGGASGEITVTFEVLNGAELEALYYSPDLYTRLVTLIEFDEQ